MRGKLDAFQRPRLQLRIRGPYGSTVFEAVVDTGFTGTLSLPPDVIQRLGLLRRNSRPMMAADGQVRVVATYAGEVAWGQGWMAVEVTAGFISEALIGAGLLRGSELRVDYGPARSVEVRASV